MFSFRPRHATRHATRIVEQAPAKPVDRRHIIGVALLASLVAIIGISAGEPAKANRTVTTLELPAETGSIAGVNSSTLPEPASTAETTETAEGFAKSESGLAVDALQPMQPSEQWTQVTIKNGDNLSMVFQRAGLSGRDVYEVVNSGAEGKALTKVFAGEKLGFVISDGELQKVKRVKSPLESIIFTRNEKGFSSETHTREPEVRHTYRSAYIEDSLFLASQRVDMPQNLTMNMANIFGGVVDFVLDVRADDHFTVLYEELYLDGEKIGNGKILAAQYVNRGDIYNAYRYTDREGETGYYNEDGVSMRKAFLRAPLDFTRISSGFNLRRLHPVTKSVRPHRGTDYAAPRGTPVFAAGDGRVIASSYSSANGKYVFIRHGEAYTTKYLHLDQRNVKNGQRVKQGQIIGKVGCTGICTGPHLHYEFLVNGVHRNPRTILKKLPKAKSLAAEHKVDFQQTIRPLQLQLASYSSSTLKLASLE